MMCYTTGKKPGARIFFFVVACLSFVLQSKVLDQVQAVVIN